MVVIVLTALATCVLGGRELERRGRERETSGDALFVFPMHPLLLPHSLSTSTPPPPGKKKKAYAPTPRRASRSTRGPSCSWPGSPRRLSSPSFPWTSGRRSRRRPRGAEEAGEGGQRAEGSRISQCDNQLHPFGRGYTAYLFHFCLVEPSDHTTPEPFGGCCQTNMFGKNSDIDQRIVFPFNPASEAGSHICRLFNNYQMDGRLFCEMVHSQYPFRGGICQQISYIGVIDNDDMPGLGIAG